MSDADLTSAVPPHVLDRLGVEGRIARFGEARRLTSNPYLTDGIWRVSSSAGEWILKKVTRPSSLRGDKWADHWTRGAESSTNWNYWMRESMSYSSGLVESFQSGGISAPVCLGTHVEADAAYIALGAARLTPASQWTLDDYAAASQSLGVAQAHLLPRPDVQEEWPSWLSRGFVAQYDKAKPFARTLVNDPQAWDGIDKLCRAGQRDRLRAFVASADELTHILSRLPQTLCHNDYWTRNLFGSAGEIQLIDWGFVGVGPIGADIGNLVPSAILDGFVDPDDFESLESIALNAYLEGLRRGGYEGPDDRAALGMFAASLKYVWLVPAMLESASQPDPVVYAGYGQVDPWEWLATCLKALDRLADWSERARAIARRQ